MNAIIVTQSGRMQLTNPGGNATSTSITKPPPTSLSPKMDPPVQGVVATLDGVIDLGAPDGSECASAILLYFFGVGADTTTGLASVYGWEESVNANSAQSIGIWVPKLLVSVSFELDSGMPGVAGTPVPASNYFATTITLVTGNSGISCEVVSPGHGNDMAHLVLSTKGARYAEVRYGLNGSSTSLNGLWKYM